MRIYVTTINKEVGGVIYHQLVVSFEKKLEM
jgi:hypothetical protein